jgi:hypothetical protein
MQDLVNGLTGPSGKDLSMVLVFLFMGATVVAIFGLIQWRKIEQRRMETSLKQEMLQRGMSADDIVRVIEGGSRLTPKKPARDRRRVPSINGEPHSGWLSAPINQSRPTQFLNQSAFLRFAVQVPEPTSP